MHGTRTTRSIEMMTSQPDTVPTRLMSGTRTVSDTEMGTYPHLTTTAHGVAGTNMASSIETDYPQRLYGDKGACNGTSVTSICTKAS